jgi:glycosyltransferase involved in cell wall biosynthesis
MEIKNKKISFFISSFERNESVHMIVNLANGFAERGYSVDLLVAQRVGSYFSEIREGVRLVDLKASRVLFSLFPLIVYLRKNRPDALIASMEHVSIIAVLAKFMSFSRTKIIIRVANTFSYSLLGTKWYKRPIRKYGAFIFYRLADSVVANSEGSAQNLSKTLRLKKKVKVIYNPTVTSDVFEKAEESVGHPWLKDKEVPVVISVGRLHEQKDFATLIKAFASRRRKEPMKLIILGEGEERKSLERLADELGALKYINMPGFMENPYSHLKRADLFVLSSKWEGLPNVLIEAMACGLPVVSTDCPSGPREILEDGKYGELVPVGDHKAMADAISKVLRERPDTEEALESVKNRFSLDRAVDEYAELINN